MKEMIYKSKLFREVLGGGTYKNYNYKVVSYGTHPCCYVEIPENNPLYKQDYLQMQDIDCHGGITFCDFKDFGDGNKYYIGWDYAHLYDFSGIYLLKELQEFDHSKDKKWTSLELKEECKEVIEQLKDLMEENND